MLFILIVCFLNGNYEFWYILHAEALAAQTARV